MDDKARINWNTYQYAKQRGHDTYCKRAKKCEDYFLGHQLSEEDRAWLTDQGRPAYEFNLIKPAVNTITAYQINNRMEIIYKPTGGKADNVLAEIQTKNVKHILNKNNYHYKETQIFSDGVIMERGYADISLDFNNNPYGDIVIDVLDPMDVIPDPDAKSYDPKDWANVTITRWYTLDEIEYHYGYEMRVKVEENDVYGNSDFGDFDDNEPRNKFSYTGREKTTGFDSVYSDEIGVKRYRIIDIQKYVRLMTDVFLFPTGDIKVAEGLSNEKVQEQLAAGAILDQRMMKRVKWTVTTMNVTLKDIISPFETFTVILYSPLFRRGVTQGLVNDAIDAQDMFTKSISTEMHLANTNSNSPWLIQEGSLVNMTAEEFQEVGSKPGLVVVYGKGYEPPQRAAPGQNNGATGTLIEISRRAVYDSTIPESARGVQSNEVSGVAIQAKQNAAQQQMVIALDQLAHFRRLLANKILEVVQKFYTNTRVLRISEMNYKTGKFDDQMIEVNQEMSDGSIVNDLTTGDYDSVITETPLKSTFDETQFEQMIKMKQFNIAVPDESVILTSSLADKYDIAEVITKRAEAASQSPLAQMQLKEAEAKLKESEAKIEKMKAEIENLRSKTTETNVKALYAGVQTAGTISQMATIADSADEIVKSAGFIDLNTAPIFKDPVGPAVNMPNTGNTNPSLPMVPNSPTAGAMTGIENPI